MNIAALSQNFLAFAQVWDRLDQTIRINDLIAQEMQRRFYAPLTPPIGYGPRSLVELGLKVHLIA
jgi:hypothetical protein